MKINTPPHPARGLKDDLDALDLNTAQAAAALGVTQKLLQRVLSQQRGKSPEMALRVETVIGASADHWLRLQAAFDLAQVRRAKGEALKALWRLTFGPCV